MNLKTKLKRLEEVADKKLSPRQEKMLADYLSSAFGDFAKNELDVKYEKVKHLIPKMHF